MKKSEDFVSNEGDPEDVACQARQFAGERLGPASERLLTDPANLARILARIRRGLDLEDAVLAEIFRASDQDHLLADEFIAYFLADLMRVAHARISPGLRRYLDTGDLVNSVLGKLWIDLRKVRFKNRRSFLAYLACGLGWKAAGHARKWKVGQQGDCERLDWVPEEFAMVPGSEPQPDSVVVSKEEMDRLIVALPRLRHQERQILTLHLQGFSRKTIASSLGMKSIAVRDGLTRAVQQARRFL